MPITIPDHVDVTGQLQQGGQYRLLLSSMHRTHTPSKTETWIFGDKGTLAFITPNNAEPYLQFGKKGGAMGALAIDPAKLGAWRVGGRVCQRRAAAARGNALHGFRYVCKIYGMDRRRDAVDARAARWCSCRCFETSGKRLDSQGGRVQSCYAALNTGRLSLPAHRRRREASYWAYSRKRR